MMWQTPLMHVNVAALVGPQDVPKFNAFLAAAVLHEFSQLQRTNPAKLTRDAVAVNDANQVFFEWQKNGGWAALRATQEMRMLEDFVQVAVDRFLRAMNLPEVQRRGGHARPRTLEPSRTGTHPPCAEQLFVRVGPLARAAPMAAAGGHCHPQPRVGDLGHRARPLRAPPGPLPPRLGRGGRDGNTRDDGAGGRAAQAYAEPRARGGCGGGGARRRCVAGIWRVLRQGTARARLAAGCACACTDDGRRGS